MQWLPVITTTAHMFEVCMYICICVCVCTPTVVNIDLGSQVQAALRTSVVYT